jgi:hypothetical protein
MGVSRFNRHDHHANPPKQISKTQSTTPQQLASQSVTLFTKYCKA